MTEQFALAVDPSEPVEKLRERAGQEWSNLVAARRRSREQINELNARLRSVVPEDTTCVVFGSLARLEFTEHSDIDWTLLVDGCADAGHQDFAGRIKSRFRELQLVDPTAGGPFGNLTFSHDLIHRIGGDDDTNRNTTQRLLLLLESVSIARSAAYERVVEQVLARYVEEDLTGTGDTPYRVPRFLLNDVVRYWRTMAVDFAHKRRSRGEAGWALRTAKLRMSRKLMYASGLLTCFSCEFEFSARAGERYRPGQSQDVLRHLSALVRTTPLDIVARVVLQYFGELSGPGLELFGAYDEFLALLNDANRRRHLKALRPSEADANPEYDRVRELGGRFQSALTEIFFVRDTPVRELTQRYGVF